LGRDGAKWASRQCRAPETWLAAVEGRGHGTEEELALEPAAIAEELVMMGLRLAEGIPRARFLAELGRPVEAVLDPRGLALAREGGFLTLDGETLAATPAGRQRLNALLRLILPA
jgi:oxygen-independent coproporphyrinogen-3 oxidase